MTPEPGRYSEILAGLHERFEGVPGINAFLDYEPSSINPPTLYSILDGATFEQQGAISVTRYTTNHYLVFLWQGREEAAREMQPYIDAIPKAVEGDPQLAGRLTSGISRVTSVRVVWRVITGKLYAALQFTSEAVDKQPVRRG